MKYKTRSVEVEAEQWNPQDILQATRLHISSYLMPTGEATESVPAGSVVVYSKNSTANNRAMLSPGDWIVTGDGSKRVLTPEQFEKEFEPIVRKESGAIKFDDDWSGLFLRGDDAFHLAMSLKSAIEVIGKSSETGSMALVFTTAHLQGIVDMILNDVVMKPVIKERDNCEVCHGTKGGVRGNENIETDEIGNKVVMCDYCSVTRRANHAV